MADDIQSNIRIDINTAGALASIKNLQKQVSAFHSSMASGSAANSAAAANMQKNLLNNINATKQFAASIQTIKTTSESFTTALEKNKLSLGQYFKYATASSKSFGQVFKTEFDTINKVARERVKDLQTQYIQLGRDANGSLKAISVRPLMLDMDNLATKTAIAAQRQQLFNQLLKQGSTNLLNWGKNTQWAGRQLMVGFSIPMVMAGTAAAKAYMQIEEASIKIKRVYGDLSTTARETNNMVSQIKQLATEYTKYGIAVADTMDMAAKAAAMGKTGADLLAQVNQASRLSALGGVDQAQALDTTISLTNAFGLSADKLAGKIDFLNAVENQTVTSIEDLTIAIPKAGPVVKQLGGNVEDLAFFLTAMREGGINASEGANALKSGLAALINPTKKASDMLASYGINVKQIVTSNKGDIKKTVIDFAKALDTLNPLNRAKAIEQMFGKFQFARLSTLFQNITKEGTQASKAAALASMSSIQLAAMSERELKRIESSPMYKFQKAIANIQAKIAPIGETFLNAITPIIDKVSGILDGFNKMSDGFKNFAVIGTAAIGGLAPVLLMVVGLVANGAANIVKLFATVKAFFNKTNTASQVLGETTSYLTTEQIRAEAVAASLDQIHTKLTQTFSSETTAINAYIGALQRAVAAQEAMNIGTISRTRPKKFASGGIVPGSGNGDTVPSMLTPGEFVVKKGPASQAMPFLQALNQGNVSKFSDGGVVGGSDSLVRMFAEFGLRLQPGSENMSRKAGKTGSFEDILAPLAMRIGESRGITPSQTKANSGAFDAIATQYENLTKQFTDKLNTEFETTFKNISDTNERYKKAWQSAGKSVEAQVNEIKAEADKGVIRKTFGLDDDFYGTIPTMPRREGGTRLERGRKSAFKAAVTGVRSYLQITPGAKALYERRTGKSAKDMQMGHVNEPIMGSMQKIVSNPNVTNAAKKAGELIGITASTNVVQGVKESTNQASPSKEAFDAGRNIGIGAINGIKSTEKEAVVAGKTLGSTQSGGVRRNPNRGRASRPAGQTIDGQFYPVGFTPSSGYDQPIGPKQNLSGRLMSWNRSRKAGKLSISSGKASAIGMGASVALGAASMAGGPLGDIAGQIAPVVGIVSMFGGVLSKVIPIALRFAGPIGIAVTALGAFITIANIVNEAKRKELEKINATSSAADAAAGSLNSLAKATGVRESNPLLTASLAASGGVKNATQVNDVNTLLQSTDFTTNSKKGEAPTTKDFIDKLKKIDSKQAVETLLNQTAQGLLARGATDKVVEDTITAIKFAAGKKDIAFNVKDIKLGTKAGQQGLQNTLTTFTSDLEKQSKNIPQLTIKSTGFVRGQSRMNIDYKSIDKTSKEYLTLANNAKMFGTFANQSIMNASQQFASGQINAKQYGITVTRIQEAFKKLGPEARKLALTKLYVGLNADQKKTADGITDVTNKVKYLQMISLGFGGEISQNIIQGMQSTRPGVAASYQAQFDALVKKVQGDAKKLYDAMADPNAGGDGANGGSGKESAYTTALKQLISQAKEIKAQTDAFNKLKKAGYDTEKAFEVAKDPILAAAIASTKVGTKEWKTLMLAIQKAKKAADDFSKVQKQTIEGATQTFDDAYSKVGEAFAAQEERLQLAYKNANKSDLELISSSESKIAALSYQVDGYNSLLEDIQTQEDAINKKYDTRSKALEKIQTLNEEISRQQKSQLDIADALSQGDIAAAARAIQSARSDQAQASLSAQKNSLDAARAAEISSVTVGGKTRAQIEEQVLSLQKQIRDIENQSLKPAQERIRLADEKLQKDIDSLTVAGKSKFEWEQIANNIRIAKTNTEEFLNAILSALGAAKNLKNVLAEASPGPVNTWKAAGIDVVKASQDYVNSKAAFERSGLSASAYIKAVDRGQTFGFKSAFTAANGGMVPKYFASGGFARGTDTVPSMLTPGEFVVKKYAVKDFGVDNLRSINNGTYNGDSVYNYNLSVNMSGSNLDANDVARTVMNQIKQIDSQRIRSSRI